MGGVLENVRCRQFDRPHNHGSDLRRQRQANSKIQRRQFAELVKIIPGKTQPPGTPRLPQVMLQHQRVIKHDPEQPHCPKWQLYPVIRAVQHQPRRAVCHAHQGSQQAQFVSGEFVVVDDDMPQRRQCSRAIIRQTVYGGFPPHILAFKLIRTRHIRQRHRHNRPVAGKTVQLGLRDFVKLALTISRPMAQRDNQHTGRCQQLSQNPERPLPVCRGQVHPNRRHQHQIKPVTEFSDLAQIRQRVIHPLDTAMGRCRLTKPTQLRRRLHRHNVPATLRQCQRIAAAAGTYIEREPGFLVQLGEPVAVDLFEGQGLVLGEEFLGVFVVRTVTHATASLAACCHIKFGIGVWSFHVILMGCEPV